MKHNEYVIQRVINNNIVVSKEKNGEEIILMGSGISFNRKRGEIISKDSVEKTFVLKGRDKTRYMDVFESIPEAYFDLAMEILDDAERKLSCKLNPTSYVMLADHIHSAVERTIDGIELKNEMAEEITFFYPDEYKLGLESLDRIYNKTNIRLPKDEAVFIAFHIINLSGDTVTKSDTKKIDLIKHVIMMTENYFDVQLDKESYYYSRFLMHLRYFSSRVLSHESVDYEDKDDFLYRMLSIEYPKITKCVNLIQDMLKRKFDIEMNTEEKGYLIVHINNLLNNSKVVT